MIQDNLLKSNFVGRDGFRWWIGQIAPSDVQDDQINGAGWGNRFKVRIMGYHPYSEAELPNDDLPWAGVLLPSTSGSGAANTGTNVKLRPGDVVVGFFLDGDNAQIPMILGAFGKTGSVPSTNFSSPFAPFTGYNDRIKPPNDTQKPDESNEQNSASQPQPPTIPPEIAKKIEAIIGEKVYYAWGGVGTQVQMANSCTNTEVDGIKAEINNLLSKIQNAYNTFLNIPSEIKRSVDKISAIANKFVGQMMNTLYNKLAKLLNEGLKLLYKIVSTQFGHLAGVAAQTAMIEPIRAIQKGLSCVAGKVLSALKGTVSDLLSQVINNITNFRSCAGNQFVGSFLNTIISDITNGLADAISGVSKILPGAFNVANFLRSTVDSIRGMGAIFDCNQDKGKCSDLISQYVIGKGPKDSGVDQLNDILSLMNISSSITSISNDFEKKYGKWDIFGSATKVLNSSSELGGCYTGPPTSCNGPTVNIFGGGGSGASATALLGSFTKYGQKTTSSIIGVQIDNPGSGYRYPPFVEFVDNCNQGYGAIGRAIINDAGEVTSIYIVSPGEFYPVDNVEPYTPIDTVVYDGGNNYEIGDTATDDLGNEYQLIIDNGTIIQAQPINTIQITDFPTITVKSKAGIGAVIVPVLGKIPPGQKEVKQVIDCIT